MARQTTALRSIYAARAKASRQKMFAASNRALGPSPARTSVNSDKARSSQLFWDVGKPDSSATASG